MTWASPRPKSIISKDFSNKEAFSVKLESIAGSIGVAAGDDVVLRVCRRL